MIVGGILWPSTWWVSVDHLGRRESLPNRLRLLFSGGGEGCTVVHMGRDVTGDS